jgi:hypothetical protein
MASTCLEAPNADVLVLQMEGVLAHAPHKPHCASSTIVELKLHNLVIDRVCWAAAAMPAGADGVGLVMLASLPV